MGTPSPGFRNLETYTYVPETGATLVDLPIRTTVTGQERRERGGVQQGSLSSSHRHFCPEGGGASTSGPMQNQEQQEQTHLPSVDGSASVVGRDQLENAAFHYSGAVCIVDAEDDPSRVVVVRHSPGRGSCADITSKTTSVGGPRGGQFHQHNGEQLRPPIGKKLLTKASQNVTSVFRSFTGAVFLTQEQRDETRALVTDLEILCLPLLTERAVELHGRDVVHVEQQEGLRQANKSGDKFLPTSTTPHHHDDPDAEGDYNTNACLLPPAPGHECDSSGRPPGSRRTLFPEKEDERLGYGLWKGSLMAPHQKLGMRGAFLLLLFLPVQQRGEVMMQTLEALRAMGSFLALSTVVGISSQTSDAQQAPSTQQRLETSVSKVMVWFSGTFMLFGLLLLFHIRTVLAQMLARKNHSSRSLRTSDYSHVLKQIAGAATFILIGLQLIVLSIPVAILSLQAGTDFYIFRWFMLGIWCVIYFLLISRVQNLLYDTNPLALYHYSYWANLDFIGYLIRLLFVNEDKLREKCVNQLREYLGHDLAHTEDTKYFFLEYCPHLLESWVADVQRVEMQEFSDGGPTVENKRTKKASEIAAHIKMSCREDERTPGDKSRNKSNDCSPEDDKASRAGSCIDSCSSSSAGPTRETTRSCTTAGDGQQEGDEEEEHLASSCTEPLLLENKANCSEHVDLPEDEKKRLKEPLLFVDGVLAEKTSAARQELLVHDHDVPQEHQLRPERESSSIVTTSRKTLSTPSGTRIHRQGTTASIVDREMLHGVREAMMREHHGEGLITGGRNCSSPQPHDVDHFSAPTAQQGNFSNSTAIKSSTPEAGTTSNSCEVVDVVSTTRTTALPGGPAVAAARSRETADAPAGDGGGGGFAAPVVLDASRSSCASSGSTDSTPRRTVSCTGTASGARNSTEGVQRAAGGGGQPQPQPQQEQYSLTAFLAAHHPDVLP